MRNLLLYTGLLLWSTTACKHKDVEPTQLVAGIYQATIYEPLTSSGNSLPYPINGQELTLQINYVSADTVSVQITPSTTANGLPAGVYSPTQTLSYPKAYIESPDNTGAYIYLMGKSSSTVSTTNPQI